MILESKTFGSEGPDMILLHGMFASKENFLSLARRLSRGARVTVPDLRNHGESFHADEMDYPSMAADVVRLVQSKGIEAAWFLGHSLGGKVAMELALSNPELVRGLIVEDVAPRQYPGGMAGEIKAMQDLPLDRFSKRSEAEAWMSDRLGNRAVARFLLKNLVRSDTGAFSWRLNLEVLSRQSAVIMGFPENGRVYRGPSLFIQGEESDYIREQDYSLIQKYFPHARIDTLKGASHWVHAEKPEEVLSLIQRVVG